MNVLFIHTDNHNPSFMGAYGGLTRTPNLDALAARGARFDAAYCNYPLCVPSRGSMFTGRYAHEIRAWSNAFPWDGSPSAWPHTLRDEGVHFTAIGKLHFKGGCDHGLAEEILPGHVNMDSHVDVISLFREQDPIRVESLYRDHWWAGGPRPDGTPLDNRTDRVTDEAIRFLRRRPTDRPWVLYVGYGKPHPVWKARRDLYEYYLDALGDLAPKYLQPVEALHPVDRMQAVHTCAYDFDEQRLRDVHAAYHAVVEELDQEIGRILEEMEREGLLDETLIVYSSDHGEMARAHGKWSKLSLYDDSARVPLLVSGPGLRRGAAAPEVVSLLDVFPTIQDALGFEARPEFRGRSLLPLARGEADPEREDFALCEIHGNGWPRGGFLIRQGKWKLMEYVGYRPALYNLEDDPDEMNDLVLSRGLEDAEVRAQVERLRAILRGVCDPEAVDEAARADQRALRAQLAETGMLAHELRNRGFEPRADRLVKA